MLKRFIRWFFDHYLGVRKSPARKLSRLDAVKIRNLWQNEGWTLDALAARFGVHREHIRKIVRNKSWK